MTIADRLRLIAQQMAEALKQEPVDLVALHTATKRIEAAAEWIEEGLEEE